jgi:hypothetical protein
VHSPQVFLTDQSHLPRPVCPEASRLLLAIVLDRLDLCPTRASTISTVKQSRSASGRLGKGMGDVEVEHVEALRPPLGLRPLFPQDRIASLLTNTDT